MLADLILAAAALAASANPLQPVPARWNDDEVRALLGVIDASDAEGLRSTDYDPEGLAQALAAGSPDRDARATAAALRLAHDYFEGRTPVANRGGWHIDRERVDYKVWLDAVLARGSVRASFARLLPTSSDYRALRSAWAACRGGGRDCDRIAVNLERWRWLPRTFGPRYLWVNVPAYRLDLVENGRVVASHKVIVGKTGTSTPVFKASVTGVTANPWWNVPCNIVNESIGKLVRDRPQEAARRGYVATRDAKGQLQVRQKPGPDNALGRIKLEMPNPYGVYIHDTPSRSLFDKDARAFSHGCIRTEAPDQLARRLLSDDQAKQLDLLLLLGTTSTLRLRAPLPVYIVYLTMEPDPLGKQPFVAYADIYRRDGAVQAGPAAQSDPSGGRADDAP